MNEGIRNFFRTSAVFFNSLAVVGLFISASASYFSPEKMHLLSYLGMLFLPFVFINICFIIFWAIHLKLYILISVISLLLVTSNLKKSFSFFKKSKEETVHKKTIKILTYNIMLFNYYKKDSKILDYIKNSNADIVCLQEFGWYKKNKGYLSKERIISVLKDYPYYEINIALDKPSETYGIATFSKYPILQSKRIAYESHFNSSIYSDIKIGNDTIRLFNNHLESNRLTEKDKFNLVENTDSKIISETAQKLGKAGALRAKQADSVSKEIKASPYKVIVCGDFNDTPISYTYKKISDNLSDTFMGSGCGLGITFHDFFYRFRIDYIFVDKSFSYSDYFINNIKISDHYPVSCSVSIE